MTIIRRPVGERFWEKVDKSGECWNWTAGLLGNGYGRFRIGDKQTVAHRVSYELVNGPIPEGLEVDHTCHNRRCVNPGHLRAVTRKQNEENHSGPRVDNKAGIRGVHWAEASQKWHAQVMHNGKKYSIGMFEAAEEAGAAAAAKRLEFFTHNDLDKAA